MSIFKKSLEMLEIKTEYVLRTFYVNVLICLFSYKKIISELHSNISLDLTTIIHSKGDLICPCIHYTKLHCIHQQENISIFS